MHTKISEYEARGYFFGLTKEKERLEKQLHYGKKRLETLNKLINMSMLLTNQTSGNSMDFSNES